MKGHILASFLALYLSATLRRALDTLWQKEHPQETCNRSPVEPARLPIPWEKLVEDLSQLRAVHVRLDNDPYLMRTELKGHAHEAFRAVGLRPPPLAQPLNS